MRRFLTLVCLLCLAIPAGTSIAGCYRNPDANYCNGLGFGLKVTSVDSIILQPQTTGISLAYGQIRQLSGPTASTCKGTAVPIAQYTYGTTNNQLVDVSPTGNLCAGTWNRNTGGGIPDYTTCAPPNPLPSTGGQPYGIAYVSVSADSITSNAVQVYVHPQVTSITLVGPQSCLSQGQLAQLDAQACYSGSNNQQVLLCAPSSVTTSLNPTLACPLPTGPTGVSVSLASIPDCTSAIGMLSYTVGNSTIASINSETNQITADMPGTTVITASVAQSGSSAGYFSTCPPKSISVTLNGATSGTVTQGVQQNLVTTVVDTQGNTITGLSLDYQSTNPLNISVNSSGAVTPSYPGEASIYAICQPATCNPAPINEVGLYGTGLPISSDPVNLDFPATASNFAWFSAPGQSQYYVQVELTTGTVGSASLLPYVPNSMVMDALGNNLYLGSIHELMVVNTTTNAVTKQDTNVPGVVLAVAPDNVQLLINDQVRQLFYLYNISSGSSTTFGGMGAAASWTPDSKTLYITDSAALNNTPANVAAGITGHTDTLYVYNLSTGWVSYPLPCSVAGPACPNPSTGAQSLAVTVPSVGAFVSGSSTLAHTWCPIGTVGNTSSMYFYPQGPTPDNTVAVQTDQLGATADGNHIFGASTTGSAITLSDIGVTIPSYNCLPPETNVNYPLATGDLLSPLVLATTLSQSQVAANAATINQVLTSPASDLAFITYAPQATGATTGASLPYYTTSGGAASSVTLSGSSSITAPIAGAFSPDNTLFFVSTAGDNMVHYISVPLATSNPAKADTQQISPNLPACVSTTAGGNSLGCTYTGSDTIVPASVIIVKPRPTT